VASTLDSEAERSAAPADEALEALLRFGAQMLRSGNTVSRSREWLVVIGGRMGFEAISLTLSSDSITISAPLRQMAHAHARDRAAGDQCHADCRARSAWA
jgi:hypothetical protein